MQLVRASKNADTVVAPKPKYWREYDVVTNTGVIDARNWNSASSFGTVKTVATGTNDKIQPSIIQAGAPPNANFQVAWTDYRAGGSTPHVWGQVLDPSGNISGSNIQLTSTTGFTQPGTVRLAYDNSTNILMTFGSATTAAPSKVFVYGQYLTTSLGLTGSQFAISTNQLPSGIGPASGLDYNRGSGLFSVNWREITTTLRGVVISSGSTSLTSYPTFSSGVGNTMIASPQIGCSLHNTNLTCVTIFARKVGSSATFPYSIQLTPSP